MLYEKFSSSKEVELLSPGRDILFILSKFESQAKVPNFADIPKSANVKPEKTITAITENTIFLNVFVINSPLILFLL